MNIGGLYTLDANGEPRQCRDIIDAALSQEPEKSTVAKTTLEDGTLISTVFLIVDHNWDGKGPPILWETMVFNIKGEFEEYQERCSGSREQAQAMHDKVVEMVKASIENKSK